MGFINTTTLTPGEQMIRRIQNPQPESPRFATVIEPTTRRCRDCGSTYYNSKREFCPRCQTFTVEAVTK